MSQNCLVFWWVFVCLFGLVSFVVVVHGLFFLAVSLARPRFSCDTVKVLDNMLLNFSAFNEVFLEHCFMVLKIKLRHNRREERGLQHSGQWISRREAPNHRKVFLFLWRVAAVLNRHLWRKAPRKAAAQVKRREERGSTSSSERAADGTFPRGCICASVDLGSMSFVDVDRQKVWSTDCTFLPQIQQQSAFWLWFARVFFCFILTCTRMTYWWG